MLIPIKLILIIMLQKKEDWWRLLGAVSPASWAAFSAHTAMGGWVTSQKQESAHPEATEVAKCWLHFRCCDCFPFLMESCDNPLLRRSNLYVGLYKSCSSRPTAWSYSVLSLPFCENALWASHCLSGNLPIFPGIESGNRSGIASLCLCVCKGTPG